MKISKTHHRTKTGQIKRNPKPVSGYGVVRIDTMDLAESHPLYDKSQENEDNIQSYEYTDEQEKKIWRFFDEVEAKGELKKSYIFGSYLFMDTTNKKNLTTLFNIVKTVMKGHMPVGGEVTLEMDYYPDWVGDE